MAANNSPKGLNYQGTRTCCTYTYCDANDNEWKVEILGPAAAIKKVQRELTKKPDSILLHAASLTQNEVAAARIARATPADALGPAHPAPSLPTNLTLEYRIQLIKLSVSGPIKAHLSIDPDLTQAEGSRTHTFTLLSGDATADVSFHATQGTVELGVYGNGTSAGSPVGANGSVSISSAVDGQFHATWQAVVVWKSGAPATYTLTADITVF